MSLPTKCGWIETNPNEGRNEPQECGERCHYNPFTDLTFYCQKGEKCCPLGAQGEKCLETCGPYNDFELTSNGTKVPSFGECTDMDFGSDCCPLQDAPCNLYCKNSGHCGYSTWVREKQQFDLSGDS